MPRFSRRSFKIVGGRSPSGKPVDGVGVGDATLTAPTPSLPCTVDDAVDADGPDVAVDVRGAGGSATAAAIALSDIASVFSPIIAAAMGVRNTGTVGAECASPVSITGADVARAAVDVVVIVVVGA